LCVVARVATSRRTDAAQVTDETETMMNGILPIEDIFFKSPNWRVVILSSLRLQEGKYV
jgi:hypothetical protein